MPLPVKLADTETVQSHKRTSSSASDKSMCFPNPLGPPRDPPFLSCHIHHAMSFLLPPFTKLLKAKAMSEDGTDDKERRVLTMETLLKERQLHPENFRPHFPY